MKHIYTGGQLHVFFPGAQLKKKKHKMRHEQIKKALKFLFVQSFKRQDIIATFMIIAKTVP